MDSSNTYTAFENSQLLAQGSLSEVVLKTKKRIGKSDNSSVLIFSDSTGKTMDFNFQGSERDVLKRLELYTSPESKSDQSGPGRPKLGVISREVSLLPRHWEWLATQSGGASAVIRGLIEEAIKKSSSNPSIKQVQERAYRIMSVLAGDLAGYEESLRSLYKRDKKAFLLHTQSWPRDVRAHLIEITQPVFDA
jgi:hypothetical protein